MRGNKNHSKNNNNDHLNNDQISYVSSRSYRTPQSRELPTVSKYTQNRASSADLLDSKITSTPKHTTKNKLQSIKPVIKFIGASRFNSSVNLSEAKLKLSTKNILFYFKKYILKIQ